MTWCENGLAFIVRDLNRFCEEVLPAHFCHNKWASFIRQLNLYGFRRITQGQAMDAEQRRQQQIALQDTLRRTQDTLRQNGVARLKDRDGG